MIRSATPEDVPVIARLIRALAEYEKLSHQAILKEEDLKRHLFGERPHAEVVLAEEAGTVVGFALFFHTYSTFLARPSLYLEDLFVLPERRGGGHGKALLSHRRGSPWSGAAGVSSGPCWTGTRPPSPSTSRSAPCP
ncbi:GNAT family N-acetyltransferase [Cystobacter fuscus]